MSDLFMLSAAQMVTDALMITIWRRGKPDALLHHSDRECGDGELLLVVEDRENGAQNLSDTKRGQG